MTRRPVTTEEGEGEALFSQSIFRVKHVLFADIKLVRHQLCAGEMFFQVGLVDGADQGLTEMELVHLAERERRKCEGVR